MIARRVVPVVLALAVALAPVALEACQVACAVHAMTDGGTGAAHGHAASPAKKHATHSCHEAVASATASAGGAAAAGHTAVTSGPHDCGHSDELPVNAGALAQKLLHAPAILRGPADFAAVPVRASICATASSARASIPIALNLPLRV